MTSANHYQYSDGDPLTPEGQQQNAQARHYFRPQRDIRGPSGDSGHYRSSPTAPLHRFKSSGNNNRTLSGSSPDPRAPLKRTVTDERRKRPSIQQTPAPPAPLRRPSDPLDAIHVHIHTDTHKPYDLQEQRRSREPYRAKSYQSHIQRSSVAENSNAQQLPAWRGGRPTDSSRHGFAEQQNPTVCDKLLSTNVGEEKSHDIDPQNRESIPTLNSQLPFRSHGFPPDGLAHGQQPPNSPHVSEGPSKAGSNLSRSTSSSARAVVVENYRYDPLDKSQIRLVKIQAEKGWKVKCEIFIVSLEYPPTNYIAISYAWGDLDRRSEIILEREIIDDAGRVTLERTPYRVTASLYGALNALRKQDRDVWVWVDALCINQADTSERTKQVQLMTDIYSKAQSVAIWLGPHADKSQMALRLLEKLDTDKEAQDHLSSMIASNTKGPELRSVVALFEREYWNRLWVVQEVLNAKFTTVYCGDATIRWNALEIASRMFFESKDALDQRLSGRQYRRKSNPQNNYNSSQVLVYQGPSSLPDIATLMELENPLLEIMRACRRKLTAKPQDKVFAILGVLPKDIRTEFIVDYNLSVKEVYISVVDFILSTSRRLDIIRECIHFPIHTGSAGLPSWCPDWSHIPATNSLERAVEYPKFAASGGQDAIYQPHDEHRKLEISAIYVDKVSERGIAVGTLTTLADHLMAFLHWRAILLDSFGVNLRDHNDPTHSAFCRTLCLDQIPPSWVESEGWVKACYHVFSSLLRDRLPYLPLDEGLLEHVAGDGSIDADQRRQFLQKHFASNMMGRCFFLTADGHMGLGSGFMSLDDIVAVPLGCSTPVLLRREGPKKEYRYVGDVYLDRFMVGEAVEQYKSGQLELRKYLLH